MRCYLPFLVLASVVSAWPAIFYDDGNCTSSRPEQAYRYIKPDTCHELLEARSYKGSLDSPTQEILIYRNLGECLGLEGDGVPIAFIEKGENGCVRIPDENFEAAAFKVVNGL
ncbi:hypothetical protein M422DRAFT_41812 [Sphaerobolus stellatus SS14]|nr:hypothetical protein M422DRAFT_41812 [Sphaerobolus stellatus SS14]